MILASGAHLGNRAIEFADTIRDYPRKKKKCFTSDSYRRHFIADNHLVYHYRSGTVATIPLLF